MRRLLLGLLLVALSSLAIAQHTSAPEGSGWSLWCNQPTSLDNDVCYRNCETFEASGDWLTYYYRTAPSGGYTKCYRQDINNDPCGGNGIFDQEYGVCDGGTPSCDGEDGSPAGSAWNSETEACECGEGQTDFFGTDGSYSCVAELEECTSGSDSFMGYVNDQPVCSYEGDCASGEQGGLVNGEWVCLPDACDTGTYVNGACITPEDTTPSPQESFEPKDTDGDGTPDHQDDDIDGDGTPNSQDSDKNGNGVLNVNEEGGNDGSATAVGGCDQPPTCSGGDPQTCALLKQQWYAMCHTEEYEGNTDGFYNPDSSEDIDSRLSTAVSDFKARVEGAPAIAGIDNFFSLSGGGSCPVYSVSAWAFDITLDQWCSPEIPWGMISGILFAVALLIAGRIAVS